MRFSAPGLLSVLVFLACFIGRANAQSPRVNCSQSGQTLNCRIDQPTVTKRTTTYNAIVFHPNDKILVNAGGCVQSGGSGATWKRFVNPSGPNSDRLYHGLISIPGRTEERIQGVIGRWIQLPSVISPGMAALVIGYEDDNYGDNGYWGHDDGTENQCQQGPGRDGGPAWVTIQIDRSGNGGTTSHPAAFDLVSSASDPNGFFQDPAWQWEKDHPGTHPDPVALCGGFPYINSNDTSLGVSLGTPPCSTQAPSVNDPNGFNNAICTHGATPGHLHGHLNWWPVTASGKIFWVDHKVWYQEGDDDYDFTLAPRTGTGLTTNNSNQLYVVEFDSDETVDHIDRGWWNDFHNAVDANGGKSGGQPGAMIDGHDAIITGLMGLDSEHGAYSELHPVFGMAIHVKDDPTDDTWALLVRNWGDEGFCSQDEMAVPLNTLSFFLPRPGATGGTANTDQLFSNNDNAVSVTTQPGGATVTLDLGAPESGSLVHGTVHFRWTMAPGARRAVNPAIMAGGRTVPERPGTTGTGTTGTGAPSTGGTSSPATPGTGNVEVEKHAPEAEAMSLFNQLPAAKKAEIENQMKTPPAQKYTRPVRRVARVNVVRVSGPVRAKRIPSPSKAARDQQRQQMLCSAYSGRIPGLPLNACQAPTK
jgi:hypothetical protein